MSKPEKCDCGRELNHPNCYVDIMSKPEKLQLKRERRVISEIAERCLRDLKTSHDAALTIENAIEAAVDALRPPKGYLGNQPAALPSPPKGRLLEMSKLPLVS